VPELAVDLIVDDEDIIREVLKEALESGGFAVIAGLGIARIFDLVARARVASGELVRVLPQVDGGGPPVHARSLGQTHAA
jgi:CheY-like chemotaxis protein